MLKLHKNHCLLIIRLMVVKCCSYYYRVLLAAAGGGAFIAGPQLQLQRRVTAVPTVSGPDNAAALYTRWRRLLVLSNGVTSIAVAQTVALAYDLGRYIMATKHTPRRYAFLLRELLQLSYLLMYTTIHWCVATLVRCWCSCSSSDLSTAPVLHCHQLAVVVHHR